MILLTLQSTLFDFENLRKSTLDKKINYNSF